MRTPRLSDTFDGYLEFAIAWKEFYTSYWHLLDDERRDAYLLDIKDGIMPPTHERDTDIDQYPEPPPEDDELTERIESRMIFWKPHQRIEWTEPPHIVFDPQGVKSMMSELQKYRHAPGEMKIGIDFGHDHAADAMRYAMMAMRDKPEPIPTLWKKFISFLYRLMRCVHIKPCKDKENCGLVVDRPACPHCGSRHTQAHSGMENEEEGCPKWACVDCHKDFLLTPSK